MADMRYFQSAKKDVLQHDIDLIDLQILEGVVIEPDRDSRISSLKELQELEHIENLDFIQKDKVRCVMSILEAFRGKARLLRAWRRRQKLIPIVSGLKSDDVTMNCDAVTMADKEKPSEDSAG
ncbi:hypothetical protein Tco_0199686 [Tanacetum coccineum]